MVIASMQKIKNFLADLTSVILIAAVLTFSVQWSLNTFTATSDYLNPRITGSSVVKMGEPITVWYDVKRYRSCNIEISRLFQRHDGREIQLQRIVQNTNLDKADRLPVVLQGQSYTVVAPIDVFNPGESEIEGVLFPRTRLHCNWLDEIIPRVKDRPGVKIKITRD